MTTTKNICDPTDAPKGHISTPSTSCAGCAFDLGETCDAPKNAPQCCGESRKDGVSVIFQIIKKPKSKAASALNALRNAKLSPEKRKEIADKAASARWDGSTKERTPARKHAKISGKTTDKK